MLNNTADQLRNLLTSLVPVKVSWFGILTLRTTVMRHRYRNGDYSAFWFSPAIGTFIGFHQLFSTAEPPLFSTADPQLFSTAEQQLFSTAEQQLSS